MAQPVVTRCLSEPMVVLVLADYLIGVPFTPLGGDWRDYLRLSSIHRDVAESARAQQHLMRMARACEASEERSRQAARDSLRALGLIRERPW